MVEKLCKHYGEEICELDGMKYYSFPDVEKLANPQVNNINFIKILIKFNCLKKSCFCTYLNCPTNCCCLSSHIAFGLIPFIYPNAPTCVR